jgi:hypothetical protein
MLRFSPAIALLVVAATSARAPVADPWNGTWTLDLARSSAAAKGGAANAYRFTLGSNGAITWEIPSLGEVVKGHVDGKPMAIHRAQPTPGLTLAVTRSGPRTLFYTVARNGRVEGGGSMTLVDGNSAWVDLTWGSGRPDDGAELVYVKAVAGGQP